MSEKDSYSRRGGWSLYADLPKKHGCRIMHVSLAWLTLLPGYEPFSDILRHYNTFSVILITFMLIHYESI